MFIFRLLFPPTIACFNTNTRKMGGGSDLFVTFPSPFYPPSILVRFFSSPSHHQTFHYCDKVILSLQTPCLESSSLLLFEPSSGNIYILCPPEYNSSSFPFAFIWSFRVTLLDTFFSMQIYIYWQSIDILSSWGHQVLNSTCLTNVVHLSLPVCYTYKC